MVKPVVFEPPPCKSAFQRALVLALLRVGTTALSFDAAGRLPRDIEVVRGVLATLGARVEIGRGSWNITSGGWPSPTSGPLLLDVEESATAARIILALAVGLGGKFEFQAAESLRRRALGSDYIHLLRALGAEIDWLGETGHMPLRVTSAEGVRPGCALELDLERSSQGASGILLALAVRGGSLRVSGPRAYVPLTVAWIRAFGGIVDAHEHEDGTVTLVCTASRLDRDAPHAIPADFSAACFFLAWAGGHGVPGIVRGAGIDGPGGAHPDLQFVLDVEQCGLCVQRELEPRVSGRMIPGAHRSDGYDERPDSVAPLTALLSARPGRHVLRASKLRYKESDRLEVLEKGLLACGFDASIDGDALVFTGRAPGVTKPKHVPRIESRGDHRMAMCFAILASIHGFRVQIDDPDCVSKSFPDFWKELARWDHERMNGGSNPTP